MRSGSSDSKYDRRTLPIAAAVGSVVYAVLLGYALMGGLRETDGKLIYAIDDAYIHLSLARHIAEDGVWGVTPYEFASCSSSLLWTLVLAPFGALVAVREHVPLVLNAFASLGCIVAIAVVTAEARAPLAVAIGGTVTAVLGAPLAWLTVIGMEHSLHALVALGFMLVTARVLARSRAAARAETVGMSALSLLTGAVRFEGLFQCLWSAVLLWRRGMRGHAVLVGLAGAAPALAYGVLSVRAGSLFFPNSVYLKGNIPGGNDRLRAVLKLVGFGVYKLAQNPFLAVLVGAAVLLVYLERRTVGGAWDRFSWATLIFVGVAAMQLHFAGTGMFFTRYASYLVVLGIAAIVPHAAMSLHEGSSVSARLREKRWAPSVVALGLVLCVAPFVYRGAASTLTAAGAMGDIYRQQYQTGRFLAAYYRGEPVILNDIGAPTYLADVRLLDIWGLASVDIARAIKAGEYGPDVVEAMARERGARIAIVYPGALDGWGGLPASWRLVATATLERPRIVTHTVGFYAVDDGEVSQLRRTVQEWADRLPQGVKVSMAR